MYLQEVGCGGVDWIDLALDRGKWGARVKTVMKLRISWNVGIFFFTSWGTVSFFRMTLLFGVVSMRCTSFALTRQHDFQTHSVSIGNDTNAWVGITDTWKNGNWC